MSTETKEVTVTVRQARRLMRHHDALGQLYSAMGLGSAADSHYLSARLFQKVVRAHHEKQFTSLKGRPRRRAINRDFWRRAALVAQKKAQL